MSRAADSLQSDLGIHKFSEYLHSTRQNPLGERPSISGASELGLERILEYKFLFDQEGKVRNAEFSSVEV